MSDDGRVDEDLTEPTAGGRRTALAWVAAVNGLLAWAGAAGLISGVLDLGPRLEERLPLDSPTLGGIALATLVAAPLSALGWLAWHDDERTDRAEVVVGALLVGWIVVQVAFLRELSFFHPLYLGIGLGLVASGAHRLRVTGAIVAGAGTVLLCVGAGLLPHLAKRGVTPTSVAAITTVGAGVLITLAGVRRAMRSTPLPLRIGGWVATLVLVAAFASIITPAIAATNVPATAIGATPTDVGLDAEEVALTTDDGVVLAAWYIPSSNGAALVLRHGAGSTRSSALGHAAVLARHGYGVLLVDARGHGDSGGRAMDFGWHGDADIAAAIDHLAERPDVTDGRIGLVGLSMGGEEAIGAMTDDRVRAVVAEGATARSAADKSWLSDIYGARGAVQEQLERLQYGLTDLLIEAGPPTPLRDAVAAGDAEVLLIAAGTMPDETHAATHIATGAPDRVEVWVVDDADHTGGLRSEPAAWEERVIAFLGQHLGRGTVTTPVPASGPPAPVPPPTTTSTTTTVQPAPSTLPPAPPVASPVAPPPTPLPVPLPTPTPTPAPPPPVTPPFSGLIQEIDAATAARMTSSWRAGCPVPLEDLRLLRLSHWGFDGAVRTGELVVHADAATDVVAAFRAIYDARFPIERMELVDEYGGDDDASMAANNTSAFNCRMATGADRWSEHAYGRAIDINPVQNPYVTRSGAVLPPSGARYVTRDPSVPGLITGDGPVVRAFAAIGWAWGGTWSSSKDYQHVSATGR